MKNKLKLLTVMSKHSSRLIWKITKLVIWVVPVVWFWLVVGLFFDEPKMAELSTLADLAPQYFIRDLVIEFRRAIIFSEIIVGCWLIFDLIRYLDQKSKQGDKQ